MILQIPLNNNLANQEFGINIGDDIFFITLQQRDVIYFSLKKNGETVVNSIPCFGGQKISPYPYLENIVGGNFLFSTQNNKLPYFEDYDITAFLYYLSSDEL